jgi:rhamnose transport system substrate-binding protein
VISRILIAATLCAAAALSSCSARAPADTVRVGIVAKSLGNGFFNAVHKGALEAAQALGKVKIIFTGPTTATAEGQIEVINALIAQHVDAIAVSANDFDALVPTLKRARQRGIKIISFDSAVAAGGRLVHLSPSSDALIGRTCDRLAAAAAPGGRGKIAILSATPTATNQNAWIAAMRAALPQFPGLTLVAVVYGDDLADKSYRETVALLKQYPDLAVIVSPSSVGIVAAAKAVEDQGGVGKVYVTGLGLPSELAGHVRQGTVKSFAIWNPIDLGYAATQIAVRAVRGEPVGPDTTVAIGRLGAVTFDADGIGPMGEPFIYDKTNVEQFARVF